MNLVRFAAALLLSASLFGQPPLRVDYACPPEDLEAFGMSCSADDPCPIFLELSSVEAVGAKLFVAGNIHTGSATLYTVLLASEDSGKTWTEPLKPIRAAAFEQIQFVDSANGWISGESIDPLPRDAFFMITTDGGKTWRQKPMFDDARSGSVAQFWFDSRTTGQLVLDRRQSAHITHEVYQTKTGAEDWEMTESTTKPVVLKGRKEPAEWRLRADGKVYHAERRASSGWEPVANFTIHIADCK